MEDERRASTSSDDTSFYSCYSGVTPRWSLESQLTAEQEQKFVKFQTLCAALSSDLDDLKGEECRYGIDDETSLLRFLQASKFDTEQAYRHFKEARQAQKLNRTGKFYRAIDVENFEETSWLYPKWSGRRDKRGLPLFIFDLANLNSSSIAAHRASSESISAAQSGEQAPNMSSIDIRRAYAVYDSLTRFVFPLCSAAKAEQNADNAIMKQIIIADISGISVRKLWQLRSYIQDFSKLLAFNYPEVLDRVFVVGAPYYFSTIWSWAKRWIDPVTFDKLKLVNPKDVSSTLSSYIDFESIPQRYGGGFTSAPEAWPDLDEKIRDILLWHSTDKSLPRGPIIWEHGQNGSKVALAVGTAEGKHRRSEIATCKQL